MVNAANDYANEFEQRPDTSGVPPEHEEADQRAQANADREAAARRAKSASDEELKLRQKMWKDMMDDANGTAEAFIRPGAAPFADQPDPEEQPHPAANAAQFSDIHLAALTRFPTEHYAQIWLTPDNRHNGCSFWLLPASDERRAFTVTPHKGIEIHPLNPSEKQTAKDHKRDQEQVLSDAITIAARMYGGNFQIENPSSPEIVANIHRLTEKLLREGLLVDHNNNRLTGVILNGQPMGQPQPAPAASRNRPATTPT
jgi:hypothetical protein